MKSLPSFRLSLSAGVLAAAATVAMAVSAPQARADALCQSWTGRLCGKTEVCSGSIITQCESNYYYFGQVNEM